MRDVAVVAFAQTEHSFSDLGWTEADLVMPLVNRVLAATGLHRSEIGFTCSGSNDYLVGTPFSFVAALDTIGAWPPIAESHVEQDAAWALYEAWTRLQHGDVDVALVYGFGKGTVGDHAGISSLSYDPYYVAPLMPGDVGMAGLQARALHDAGFDVDPDPTPPPPTDGAAAVLLAAGEVARRVCARPAWITGIDHRIEPHGLGTRDLTRSESARLAGERAGVSAGPVDVAELHTRFEHEEPLLRRELGLAETTVVNASGGPRKADPVMATGLIRIGEAAARIHDGGARRAVAHAAAGPCLQHNLVCVLDVVAAGDTGTGTETGTEGSSEAAFGSGDPADRPAPASVPAAPDTAAAASTDPGKD